jgi:hypothetical protein
MCSRDCHANGLPLSSLLSLALCVPSSLSVSLCLSLFVSVLRDDELCFFIEFFDELYTVSSIRLPRKNFFFIQYLDDLDFGFHPFFVHRQRGYCPQCHQAPGTGGYLKVRGSPFAG